jgi:ribosomal-protein-alanine N-acetyltransferase
LSHETDLIRLFFADPPRIETARLLLRPLELSDAEAIYAYAKEPEVTKHLMWDRHRSIEDTYRFLQQAIGWRQQAASAGWGIVVKDSQSLIGTIGLHNYEEQNKCIEMGYVISQDYWNQGLMTEAVRAVIDKTFSTTPINRIQAHHYFANVPSGRVMEKAGMQYEGTFRKRVFIKGEFRDIKMYAILRSDHA